MFCQLQPTLGESVIETTDVLIIGTGFAGLGMAIRLQQAGRSDFLILERAAEVGGTWRDNAYPGAACDVESFLYSFSFEPNPDWSHMFARQGEIWAYMRGVAEKYALRPRIRFGAGVAEARFDEATQRWDVLAEDGRRFRARVLVTGCGGLSRPKKPEIEGLDSFTGTLFHSARWKHDDFGGKRVAVIGTGASAIQIVPAIAPEVARLFVYQRTAPWIMPRPDRPISPREKRMYRAAPGLQRLTRNAIFWRRELYGIGMIKDTRIMALGERIAKKHLARGIADLALREKLTPNYQMGCKRILLSNDYYPALCRENVELCTEGIERIVPEGIRGKDGQTRAVDAIVLATGFEAAEQLAPFDIFGRDDKRLDDLWIEGSEAYRGTTVAGFPNLFMIVGPNTGLGHGSMIYMIEAQIAYILSALEKMRERGVHAAEVRLDVQQRYNDEIQGRLAKTVWATGGCQSWYRTRTGKNTTLWPGFMWQFQSMMRDFDADAYTLEAARPDAVDSKTDANATT